MFNYRWDFRLLRRIVKVFSPRFTVKGQEHLKTPCIFVSRHLNNYGPIGLYVHMPCRFRLWVFQKLTGVKDCRKHLYEYTFTQRVHYPRFIAAFFAWALSGLAYWLFTSLRAISVNRVSLSIRNTFEETIQALHEGTNVMILADTDYTSTGGDVGELYPGFVFAALAYQKKSGEAIPIVPVSLDPKGRKLTLHEPLYLDPDAPFHAERERLLRLTKQALTLAPDTSVRKAQDPSL